MKGFKRVIAFVLTIVTLACSVSFAADPAATIVSPAPNSISTSDSLLVSVKLNQPCTVKITVYEEKIKNVEILTKREIIDPVSGIVSGSAANNYVSEDNVRITTYSSITYKSVDTTSFEAIDFVSNAALATYVDRVYVSPVTYKSTEKIGFYTKQISGVKPGLYKISVQVLNKDGKVTETTSRLIAVKAKPAVEDKVVFEQKQSGALKVIQNLLKSIFK